MYNIYIKYFNEANYGNKLYKKIQTIALKFGQKLQIKNNKRQEPITLLQLQVAKSNQYKKIFYNFQNAVFINKN